ncbi:MAG TPA: thiamine pyrophosphate-dependent enzyme, partial [Dehalococcoidia bacterium]
VRDYTKWDDQPASVADFPESLIRAHRIAVTEPAGPVYLCYDIDLQEQPLTTPLQLPDMARFPVPRPVQADPDALAQAAQWLAASQWPVIVADATCRHPEALPHLEALAELLSAPVISSGGYNIASNHPLNFSPQRTDMLQRADVVLALDVADVQGTLGHGTGPEYFPDLFVNPDAKIVHISLWDLLNGSWASDFERLAAVDLPITGATRLALPALVDLTRRELERDGGSASRIADRRAAVEKLRAAADEQREANARRNWDVRPISLDRVYGELWPLVKDMPWTEVGGSAGRRGGFEMTQREQSTAAGGATGAGLGLATGTSVGAAYALKDSGRLCFTVLGDGELLYTPSALYTASQQSVPLLAIVNDNRSYGNDEGHQELMARHRNRPVENKGVGIYIEDPSPDFASIAKGFDVEAFGPVEDPAQVGPVLKRAVDIITREQRPVLVDIVTQRPRRG